MDADIRAVVEGLGEALSGSGLTQAEFAAALGTSASRFSAYRAGKTVPSAAFYLRAATDAKIEGIYYGTFERTRNGLTPVLRLDGLLNLYDWIRALEQFNKDGDYSSFKHLFNREGLPGDLLGEAAFLERIANASLGSQKLDSAMQKINNCAPPSLATNRSFQPPSGTTPTTLTNVKKPRVTCTTKAKGYLLNRLATSKP